MSTSIGIFAHVDGGKTTLSEQILYYSGQLRQLGRVDKKNAFLDYNAIERARGITVFSDESAFLVGKDQFFIIDTPGHSDFSGEMERSIWAIDCAVLVISAIEGVQSQTEVIWKLLHKNKTPTIIFLNKCDRDNASPNTVINYINKRWGITPVFFDDDFANNIISNTVREDLATTDERLMDIFIKHPNNTNALLEQTKKLIKDATLFPCVKGSALNGIGTNVLFSLFEHFFKNNDEFANKSDFSARVYKIRHDNNNERIAFLKILSGKLNAKDSINCPLSYNSGEIIAYKANELRRYSGNKFTSLKSATIGDLCAVTGLANVIPGDIIGIDAKRENIFEIKPLLAYKVLYDDKLPITKILAILRIIEDEEPLLGISYNEFLKIIHIHIMGEMQLDVLKYIVKQRFGIDIDFGNREIMYKETIENSVIGHGHYEPLRHYAEVHLEISPAPKNSGITFSSNCNTDYLSLNWQRLIETHVFEKEHKGVLIGAPITDIHIKLLAGKAHIEHTAGGDFRESTYRAIRQGLMQAKSVLLEPYFKYEIQVDISLSGKILTDIQNMGGDYDSPKNIENDVIITGSCPVRTMQDYSTKLVVMTKGNGHLNLSFDEYRPCTIQNEIVQNRKYEPDRDLENTPDSVFCSHGVGITVKWFDASKAMHISI